MMPERTITTSTLSSGLGLRPAVIAETPLIGVVQRPHLDRLQKSLGCERAVELSNGL